MSLLFKREAKFSEIPQRPTWGKGGSVSAKTAMRQSAVWGAVTLRADLMSSFPIDVFRRVGAIQVEVPKPPVIVNPSPGRTLTMREWMYSTQMDLDRVGNCYGLIREVDAVGKPRVIELASHEDVSVRVRDGVVTYQIKGKTYEADEVWHEKQYTLPGHVMGLSPIAHAAWSLGIWASAAEFAADWFGNYGMIPTGTLRNTKKTLQPGEADLVKTRFKESRQSADIFVTGNDWEFSTNSAAVADAKFLEAQHASDQDIARFFGVPGDMIDVAAKGSSITYANITQRNLQFLITKMGPAVSRREDALSSLLPAPRFVKLNTSAILRMDPETQSRILINEVNGKITAPSEARALMNRPPFTTEQLAEFAALGIVASGTPAPATVINTTTGEAA